MFLGQSIVLHSDWDQLLHHPLFRVKYRMIYLPQSVFLGFGGYSFPISNIRTYVYTYVCIYVRMYIRTYVYSCIPCIPRMYVYAYVCIYMHSRFFNFKIFKRMIPIRWDLQRTCIWIPGVVLSIAGVPSKFTCALGWSNNLTHIQPELQKAI